MATGMIHPDVFESCSTGVSTALLNLILLHCNSVNLLVVVLLDDIVLSCFNTHSSSCCRDDTSTHTHGDTHAHVRDARPHVRDARP